MILKAKNHHIKKLSDKEIWKRYNENYEVSSHGNVRSIDRVITTKKGWARNMIGVQFKLVEQNDGYYQVSLTRANRSVKVHRLVAELFIPNPENKNTVNHKDGVKTNNHVSNLEWATYSENNKHARDMGLCVPKGCQNPKNGIEHWNKKLDELQIRVIKSFPAGTLSQSQLGRYFNVSPSLVYGIRSGKRWKHLNKAA